MKIKELSLRQARRLCSRNKGWCDDCMFKNKCISAFVADSSISAKSIGEEKVPEKALEMMKKEGILW